MKYDDDHGRRKARIEDAMIAKSEDLAKILQPTIQILESLQWLMVNQGFTNCARVCGIELDRLKKLIQ